MVPKFVNASLSNFGGEDERRAFEAALRLIEGERDREWPLIVGGRERASVDWIEPHNPAEPAQRVGRVGCATREIADEALAAAEAAYSAWSRTPAAERARLLLRAAAIMRRRRHELSAQMVVEIGKSWIEADADTAEAIDFCEYYAREMLRLADPQPLVTAPGTANELVYQPIGVGLVVPPWNFPCAIATGMVAAAVVAGNCVLFKPASLTPLVAARVMEILVEAGLPSGVVNFIPGPGDQIGDYLVQHPRVRFVSFTGSREVGCRIYAEAAQVRPGQRWLKRVVAEMGGKDAIVVDDSWRDLESAAEGIVASAYGFQGQKCSACSRLIVVDRAHDRLLDLVAQRAQSLRIGDPREPTIQFGPVASRGQLEKVSSYLEVGKQEGRLVLGGGADDARGWCVEPTIFADVAPRARIAQEEIFGPVLAVLRARDFGHALEIANDTVYGLTGAVYARDPAKLEAARREFRVGNLYLNRKCTGARVGVEPFGGFDMSGTNAKAGGPDYLEHFLDAKVMSEAL
jgi:1-pyrroline-5-carboxylate dehydrogenase